ncbi:MAG: CopG family transcriptional regulator [Firmicutes bacterium]|nr:CopG family transcriptional regulator [Bacillota bacterium]
MSEPGAVRQQDKRIGVVGIVVEDRVRVASRVQDILSKHGDIIVGRMGLPYKERDVAVIALIVDGTSDEVGALTGKLGSIPGVVVRSTLTAK